MKQHPFVHAVTFTEDMQLLTVECATSPRKAVNPAACIADSFHQNFSETFFAINGIVIRKPVHQEYAIVSQFYEVMIMGSTYNYNKQQPEDRTDRIPGSFIERMSVIKYIQFIK